MGVLQKGLNLPCMGDKNVMNSPCENLEILLSLPWVEKHDYNYLA